MHKVLIAYVSRTGKTEKMANLIAEGLRMGGQEPVVKKVSELKKPEDLEGHDGYVFGCPTYHRDITEGMKQFLFLAENLNLVGKIGGAFNAYTHSGESGGIIHDTMKYVYKMDTTDLGPLELKEATVETEEGARACQDYGKAIGQKLGD